MDALIAQTEKLIEKKKAIKQGVMQELLKPKEGWVTKKLGEVCELRNGYAFQSQSYLEGGAYNIITISNVQDGFLETSNFSKITQIPIDIQSHQILKKGDILVSLTGNVGRLCKVSINNCLLNQRVGKLTPTTINHEFLYCILQNSDFRRIMIQSAVGGAQGNIGKDTVLNYTIVFPLLETEQLEIATAYSDLTTEIGEFSNKLKKLKHQKQGMMQALLTGKIRLI
jgi:type I restriction enzyme S subunit